eukprot:CAMPEP_0174314384 /NCGR_PEP_ID=MMETSP0810-20121108/5605_1 /TAXON_ID=73025 ORGANISM="Eutreptiella gymnastica-like, Strain CCMP1594" /NCGR_SAMPLE_ID=MMETSP0810 /ASSEMBLY_ACC=CAM_ASM_000659 /LENGTH=109 /DNA_ID=CAMNT_0015423461 /DNA_START=331 /DNA_END=660 /DNA_ORIENTATION=+
MRKMCQKVIPQAPASGRAVPPASPADPSGKCPPQTVFLNTLGHAERHTRSVWGRFGTGPTLAPYQMRGVWSCWGANFATRDPHARLRMRLGGASLVCSCHHHRLGDDQD